MSWKQWVTAEEKIAILKILESWEWDSRVGSLVYVFVCVFVCVRVYVHESVLYNMIIWQSNQQHFILSSNNFFKRH